MRHPAHNAVARHLALGDAEAAQAALSRCPTASLDDQAFRAAATVAIALLDRLVPWWDDPALRTARDAPDPVIAAFARLPSPAPFDPALHRAQLDRLYATVAAVDPADDLVAGLVRASIVLVAFQQRRGPLHEGRPHGLEHVPCLRIRLGPWVGQRILHTVSPDSARAACEQMLADAPGATGRLVDAVRCTAVYAVEAAEGRAAAYAYAQRHVAPEQLRAPTMLAGAYYELMATEADAPDRVARAIEGLYDLNRRGRQGTVAVPLMHLLLREERVEEATAIYQDLATVRPLRGGVADLLAAALGQPVSARRLQEAMGAVPPDGDVEWLLLRAVHQVPPLSPLEGRLRYLMGRLLAHRKADCAPMPDGGPWPLGAFDLGGERGRGAHGAVYSAVHHHSGQRAAVKVLLSAARGDLEAEARLLGRLRHPAVVSVLGMGRVDAVEAALSGGALPEGHPYVAMEVVEGATLRSWCGRLGFDEVRGILLTLLDALAHAHARGVLHLDIKPANVLLEPGPLGLQPKLADFGVAGLLTGGDSVAGSPAYMAPEQWSGRRAALGPATDLYGLGCLAFRLLAGRRPFAGSGVEALREAHRHGPRPRLPGASPGLAAWFDRMLAVHPGDRFPSAAAAAEALRGCEPPSTRAVGSPVPDDSATFTFSALAVDEGAALWADTVTWDGTLCPRRPDRGRHWPPTPRGLPLELVLARLDLGPVPPLEPLFEALWDRLRALVDGEGRHVGLRGDVRTPTTWLAHAAREAGVARVEHDGTLVCALVPGGPTLVVGPAHPDADEVLEVPMVPDDALVEVLRDRMPMPRATAQALATGAMGRVDLALAAVRDLARRGAWTATEEGFDAAVEGSGAPQEAARAWAATAEVPEAAVLAALTGRAVAAGPLRDELLAHGLCSRDGELPEGVAAALRGIEVPEATLRAALEATTGTVARARLWGALGDAEAAATEVMDAAGRALTWFDAEEGERLLDLMLEMELPRGPRYLFERGRLAHLQGRGDEAHAYLFAVESDPVLRFQARAMRAYLEPDPARRLEALTGEVAAAAVLDRHQGLVQRRLGEAHALLGDFASSRRAFEAAAERSVPHLRPRTRLSWLLAWLPRDPDPRWEAALDDVVACAPALEAACRGVRAFTQCMTGRLDPVRAWAEGDASVAGCQARLVLAVATDDAPAVRELLAGRYAAALVMMDGAWAVQWWLAAAGSEVDWDQTVRRWPAHASGALGHWVAHLARDRVGADRRAALDAALATHVRLPPPWPDDVPPLDEGAAGPRALG